MTNHDTQSQDVVGLSTEMAPHERERLLLRLSAIAYLKAYGGAAARGDVLRHLRKLTRSDANISVAVTQLENRKRIRLSGASTWVLDGEPGMW